MIYLRLFASFVLPVLCARPNERKFAVGWYNGEAFTSRRHHDAGSLPGSGGTDGEAEYFADGPDGGDGGAATEGREPEDGQSTLQEAEVPAEGSGEVADAGHGLQHDSAQSLLQREEFQAADSDEDGNSGEDAGRSRGGDSAQSLLQREEFQAADSHEDGSSGEDSGRSRGGEDSELARFATTTEQPGTTEVEKVADASEAKPAAQGNSSTLPEFTVDGISFKWIQVLFRCIDESGSGDLDSKEWGVALQGPWSAAFMRAMYDLIQEEPDGANTTNRTVHMADFCNAWEKAVLSSFEQMTGGQKGIPAADVEKWAGVSPLEKRFVGEFLLDNQLTKQEFAQFLFTAMLFRALDLSRASGNNKVTWEMVKRTPAKEMWTGKELAQSGGFEIGELLAELRDKKALAAITTRSQPTRSGAVRLRRPAAQVWIFAAAWTFAAAALAGAPSPAA